jgi:hypothetical protein
MIGQAATPIPAATNAPALAAAPAAGATPPQRVSFTGEVKVTIEEFGKYVCSLQIGSPEFHELAASMKDEETFKSYAGSLGYAVTSDEARQIVELNREVSERIRNSGTVQLSDEALGDVAGGINFTALGAVVGGGIALVGASIAFLPFAATGATAAVLAGSIGATTGFGGAAGTAVGAIIDALK